MTATASNEASGHSIGAIPSRFEGPVVLVGGTGPQNNLAADPGYGSAAFGDLAGLVLGRFPFWMRTHRAVTTGVDAGLVDVLLTGAVGGRLLAADEVSRRRHGRDRERAKARVRGTGSHDWVLRADMVHPCG